jgi:hypothetical protein
MTAEILNSERVFQLWSYSASHGELLFRSTKSPEFPTRIDVLFKGVKEFHLPTTSKGLLIELASDKDARKLCTLRQSPSFDKDVKIFRIQGAGFVGYIAALIALWHEDDGEYHESSFFAPRQ